MLSARIGAMSSIAIVVRMLLSPSRRCLSLWGAGGGRTGTRGGGVTGRGGGAGGLISYITRLNYSVNCRM